MSEWINGIKGCSGPLFWYPCLECRHQRDPIGCRAFRRSIQPDHPTVIEYVVCRAEIAELTLNQFLRDNEWVDYKQIRIEMGR
jgi:hypothetical protein